MAGDPVRTCCSAGRHLADPDGKSVHARVERADVHLLWVDDLRGTGELLEGKVRTMTMMEKMQKCTKEELAKMLCRMTEDTAEGFHDDGFCCDACVAKEFCSNGHNGFLTWLDRKVAAG